KIFWCGSGCTTNQIRQQEMQNHSWLFVQPRKGQFYGINLSDTNLCPCGQLLHDGLVACRAETWHYGIAQRARSHKWPTAYHPGIGRRTRWAALAASSVRRS